MDNVPSGELLLTLLAAAEQSPASIVITDLDANIQYVNRRFSEVTGYAPAEVIGKNPRILQSGRTPAGVYEELWRTLVSGQAWRGELANRRKNGEVYWEQAHIAPVRDDAGVLRHYVAVKLDVTDSHQAMQLLQESEARFHAMFSRHCSVMLLIAPKSGRIEDANQAAADFYGYPISALRGMYIHQINTLSEAEIADERRRALTLERNYFVFPHRLFNGEIRIVEVHSSPVEVAGKFLLFSIIHDVTHRIRAEEALQHNEEQLRFLLETSPIAVRIAGQAGRKVVFANQQYARLVNTPLPIPEDADPRSYYANPEEYDDILRRLAAGDAVNGRLVELLIPGEGAKWVLATYLRIEYRDESAILGWFYEVTALKQAQLALERESDQNAMLLRNASDGIYILDQDGLLVQASDSLCRMLDYRREEMLGMHVSVWDDQWQARPEAGRTTFEARHRCKSGRLIDVEISSSAVTIGGATLLYCSSRDITERKRLHEELQLAAMVYQNSSEAMTVTDAENRIVAINPAFLRMTGYTEDEVLGQNPRILNSGRQDAAFYQHMWQSLDETGYWQGEIWNRRKNGDIYPEWLTINTIRHDDGSVYRRVALFSDISKKKETEELIWRQANFDVLTQLPNRRMFRDRLEQEIKKAHRNETGLALLFIDLDRFKEVNDSLGHEAGDMLLVEAARRISASVRESDTVARLGGDEFTVILGRVTSADHVEMIAQNIIGKLAEPFALAQEMVYISASVGITLYPGDATEADGLIKNADQSMYVAKNAGRNRFSYFTPSLQEEAQHRLRLIADLRGALADEQFRAVFQPIVELASGRVHKAEALIRWQHPRRGMVSPAAFIPLAEETGLIAAIGDWIFRETADWIRRWNGTAGEDFQVSVNMSPVQFMALADTPGEWRNYLETLGLSGRNIAIEITEGLLLHTESTVVQKLRSFREAGVQISIDDFGTGYSSLSYLKKFDIDYLKIDQSFVRDLEHDENDRALTGAIVVMAHRLGLKVIAEGVETEGQRAFLSSVGCDYGQGYLFSKPLPPETFEAYLNEAARHNQDLPEQFGGL